MKRRTKKLTLHRETLRHLSRRTLERAAAGDEYSYEGGETCCWCTGTCNTCDGGELRRGDGGIARGIAGCAGIK